MGPLEIEFEPPTESGLCSCCGGRTTSLTRFVYRNGDAYAIYYARFSDNHPNRNVLACVSLGEWGEDATPDDRLAFALEIRSAENEYQVRIMDASESPWKDAKVIGRTLDRTEALDHPWVPQVFEVTDRMIEIDEPLRTYLDGA